MTFWDSDTWREYERLCGDEPGTRAQLLASADWQTRVVDLSLSEAELWRGVRRSYHSLINRAKREHEIWTGQGLWSDLCRPLHAKVSGRSTRPIETWRLMDDWTVQNCGVWFIAGHTVREHMLSIAMAYIYVVIHGAWSYYHGGVSLEKNLSHALLWHAMKALKARGVRWFEFGWLERAGDTHKERGIVHFKRGWPGKDIPAKEAPELCGPSV